MTEEIKLCDEDYDVVGAILPKDNRDKNILNIDKYTWSTVVNMYVNALDNSYVHQLQWTPLKNMKVLSTDSFYNKYVQDSSIVVLNAFWFKCRSYVMRPDGNVRSVTLVSPLIFLVIECFGRMIYQKHNKNTDTRLKRYYSGNYDDNDPKYRTSYMSYCKDVNHESGFSYYIKTDIKNFYDSISIDLLFDKIIEKTDNDPHLYSFHFFKELLKYAGYGKYPTIDNSVALSYLASMLFLEDVDTDLSSYIQSIPIIKDYKLIRYQDDMYVLFNTHNILSDNELDSICSRIEKHYATTLSNIGLTMNLDKEKHGGANEINLVQINLSYNDSYPAFEGTINENELHEHFNYYLDALEKYDGLINFKTYQDIISSTFIHHAKVGEVQNIERSPNENYNFFVYKYKQSDTEVERLISVVNNHPDLTFLDPKRLFTIAKNTSDENLRQRLFNSLLWPVHNNSDNNEWDAYCLISGIEYLLKTDGMCHKKLRINIKNHNPGVDQFIVHYCNCLSRTIKEDSKESFRIFLTKKPRAFFCLFNVNDI